MLEHWQRVRLQEAMAELIAALNAFELHDQAEQINYCMKRLERLWKTHDA